MGSINRYIKTSRGTQFVRYMGDEYGDPILLIHGNAIHSKMWELAFQEAFNPDYFYIAPDLRGFGNADASLTIDATKGIHDWVQDLSALIHELQLDRVTIIGHSLGGIVAWGLLAEQFPWIDKMLLVSPGSPFGFGGAKGESGELINPDASGSGASIIQKDFVHLLKNKELGSIDKAGTLLHIFNNLFHSKIDIELLTEIASLTFDTHLGDKAYPGDIISSNHWPNKCPGRYGPVNAISAKYLTELKDKLLSMDSVSVPIAWIHGDNDPLVSNNSYADAAVLGRMGLLKNYPGDAIYPSQPMVAQTQWMLDQMAIKGSVVERYSLSNCGHFPFLEQSKQFKQIASDFISKSKVVKSDEIKLMEQ